MTIVFGGTLDLTQLNYSLQEQLVQMSTTHSHFDQYCIIHSAISHGAALEPSPEVRRVCPIVSMNIQLCNPLATKPGDATVS